MDNEVPIMSVLRVPPLGKLVVEAHGQRYEKLVDVSGPETRQLLLAAIGELIVFADGYDTLVNAGVAPPLSTSTEGDVATSLEQRQAAFLTALEKQRDAMRATLESPTPAPVVPQAAAAAAATEAEPTPSRLSIVQQIDAVLQKHLAAEPRLEGRSIHLEQAPEGGLRIKVDGEYFERPTDVKETEIQLVIKMALKEWEAT